MKTKVQGVAIRFDFAVPAVYFKWNDKWVGAFHYEEDESLRQLVKQCVEEAYKGNGIVVLTEWGWIVNFDKEVETWMRP